MTVVETLETVAKDTEVAGDSCLLVGRTGEAVGETTRGETDGALGDADGATDRGQVWAGGGEDGLETSGVAAVVGLAGGTWTSVTRREDNGDTTGAELTEKGADTAVVSLWNGLLVLTVTGRQGGRELVVRLVDDKVQEVEVWLVLVVSKSGLVEIRDERATTTSGVVCGVDWVGQRKTVLSIEVGLDTVVGRVLIVKTAVNQLVSEVAVEQVWCVDGSKLLEIVVPRILLEESIDTEETSLAQVKTWDLPHLIQSSQTVGSDGRVAEGGVERRWVGACRAEVLDLKDLVGHGSDLAEAGGGLDHVDVWVELAGDRVAKSPDLLELLVVAAVDLKGSVEQLLSLGDIAPEVDPFAVVDNVLVVNA